MLRTARTHPEISAYHALEGVHDFNRVSFAPPGGRWTIFNPPETRGSWEPRAISAWYVGPAYNHYRCWEFWVPATGGYRISGNARFYPEHCKLPIEEPVDRIEREAKALNNSIKEMMDGKRRLPGRHAEALTKLNSIFNLNGESKQTQQEKERPNYQTSSAPTMKAAVRAAPRAHS